MKLKMFLLSVLAVFLFAGAVSAQSLTVQDVTGTTNKRTGIRGIVFPNGTVSITGTTATISGIGASFTNGSSISDTGLGVFLFGGAASATPHTQQFTFQNASGSNTAGANTTITGSIGTGTGIGGNVLFQIAPPGTTGSSLNTASTVATLFGTNNQSSGTSIANALISLTPTVNQTSTAGYDGVLINVTESGTGSGTKNILDLAVGGTAKLSFNDLGQIVFGNTSILDDSGAGAIRLGGAAGAVPVNYSITGQAGTGSNIAGGNLLLSSGNSTGTGRSFLRVQVPIPGLTGSSANTLADRLDAGSLSLLGANNTATAFATVTLGTTGLWSAQVFWTLNVTDGTDVQSFSGMSTVALVCKGTTVTATITETAGNQSKAVSTGTITEAITQTNSGGVVTLKMTANSSLTATIERFDYVIVPMSNVSPALQ